MPEGTLKLIGDSVCPLCGGAVEVREAGPLLIAQPCERPGCVEARKREKGAQREADMESTWRRRFVQAGAPETKAWISFRGDDERFVVDADNRGAVELARAFGLGGEWNGKRGLYLYGLTGRGKTFLSYGSLSEAVRRTTGARWYTERGLFDALHEVRQGARIRLRREIAECPFLVVDDFATDIKRNMAETYFWILNHRQERELTTVLTSNYTVVRASADMSFGDLALGTKIASRLAAYFFEHELTGPNRRMMGMA